MALTHIAALVAAVSVATATATAAPTPQTIAHIHGRIVSIDAKAGTFQIHHDPFPMMPMAMTMAVQPKDRAVVKTLHVGEIVNATVDTAVYPWPGTDIRPAGAASAHAR